MWILEVMRSSFRWEEGLVEVGDDGVSGGYY